MGDSNIVWLGIGVLIGAGLIIALREFNVLKAQQPATVATAAPASYVNEEVYEWVDWKGRNRTLKVHRNARETG